MLSQEQLQGHVLYDPETGLFNWLTWRQGRRKIVGCFDKSTGYIKVTIDKQRCYGHTLAWLYMTGEWTEVDHKNHIRHDNRFNNLRKCTRSQNLMNRTWPEDATPGVTWHKTRQKWVARIHYQQKIIHLGVFVHKEDAIAARLKAVKHHHGDFASK